MRTILFTLFAFAAFQLFSNCRSNRGFNSVSQSTMKDTIVDSSRLSFYKGDTIAYVNYIVRNQIKYIDHPLSNLLDDLEFEIRQFSFMPNLKNMYRCSTIVLTANSIENPGKPDKNGINQNIAITLGFKTPVSVDTIFKIIRNNTPPGNKWSQEANTFFGKQIVGKLLLNYYMKRN